MIEFFRDVKIDWAAPHWKVLLKDALMQMQNVLEKPNEMLIKLLVEEAQEGHGAGI